MVKKAGVKTVCVVCKKERNGLLIVDDPVIKTIRKIKARLGWLQGNRLVVCEDDVDAALAKRARFEKYLMWCAMLALGMLLVLTFTSRAMLFGLLAGIFGGLLVMLMPVAAYYPQIDGKALNDYMGRRKKKPAEKKK